VICRVTHDVSPRQIDRVSPCISCDTSCVTLHITLSVWPFVGLAVCQFGTMFVSGNVTCLCLCLCLWLWLWLWLWLCLCLRLWELVRVCALLFVCHLSVYTHRHARTCTYTCARRYIRVCACARIHTLSLCLSLALSLFLVFSLSVSRSLPLSFSLTHTHIQTPHSKT